MKRFLTVIAVLFIATVFNGQNIPVTFYFEPPYEGWDSVRVAGSFNGWNNNDPNWTMHDDDGDGIYQVTNEIALGVTHDYKFVFDADWSQAFTDPNNPRININDNNNSRITPTDPMLTYLLPRDVNSFGEVYVDTTTAGEPIMAVLAFTDGAPVDPASIYLNIDGNVIDNVSEFYDEDTKVFSFTPTVPLMEGSHTVIFEMTSSAGTASDTTTFERLPGFAEVFYPIDFYFDQNSSRYNITQTINNVSVMGEFNGWNNIYDPMNDADGDGLWEAVVMVKPGVYQYKFQANGGFWVNDFDLINFDTGGDNNNLYDVEADSIPRVILKSPKQGKIFKTNNSFEVFDVLAVLRAGVGSDGVDETTVALYVDGVDELFDFDTTTARLTSTTAFGGPGEHELVIKFKTKEGKEVEDTFTFALTSPTSGYNAIDSYSDEVYSYPSGVADGSGDLEYLNISTVSPYDSIYFEVRMADITDRTRLGVLMCNPVASLADDSRNLDLLLPDWQNEGLFISIAPPGNPYFNGDIENRYQVSREPAAYSTETINVNANAVVTDKFKFALGLDFLESVMGTWFDPRDILIFSYIADTDGSGNGIEITSAEDGSDDELDVDIYDAFFIRDAFWQDRIFNNFIADGVPFGPMKTALDGNGRGIATLEAGMISDSLAVNGPRITILTPGVTYWYNNLTIHGEINDSSITTAEFHYNGNLQNVTVTDGHFSVPVLLNEGMNEVYVVATDTAGYTANSKTVRMNYEADKEPYVYINSSVNSRTVTFTAEATSPINSVLTYEWTTDPNNPGSLTITGGDGSVQVEIPAEYTGEYFINCRVEDTEDRSYKARRLIRATSDMVDVVEDNEHADWIESAIIYEIFPRSFSTQGGFNGIKERIPAMLNLGINTVWLMPIYPGPTTHGYEIVDYFGIEEDYGTEQDFRDMMQAFHENGIKVVLDWVVNHTSIQHRFIQNVFEYGEYSPWADWYLWEGVPGASNYEFYFDWASLPNLNVTNDDVQKYFIEAAKYWVQEYNIDGFRCDVAWGVEERSTTYWQNWRRELKNIKPELYLLAEANSENVYYENRFESAYDWDARNRIIGIFNGNSNIAALDAQIRKTYPENAMPFRFIENHDEARIISTHGKRRALLAQTIIFTLDGIPLLYAGSEAGELTMRDLINWSDPSGVRPYFNKLLSIRAEYYNSPSLQFIANTNSEEIYSYAVTNKPFPGDDSSIKDKIIVTVANFSDNQTTTNLNLSQVGAEGDGPFYLTDLFTGNVITIQGTNLSSVPVQVDYYSANVYLFGDSTDVSVDDYNLDEPVTEYNLMQNFPNPFNPTTTIKFALPEKSRVKLDVYNILGEKVGTLVNAEFDRGNHSVEFNAASMASGIYFYTISAGDYVSVKKMMLLK